MKKRYTYLILFGVAGLIPSVILSVLAAGLTTGVLWLFVLGDDRWPIWTRLAIGAALFAVFLASWATSLVLGFRFGQRMETSEGTRLGRHIMIALAVVVVLVVLVLLHQWSVGNLGPRPQTPEDRCERACKIEGYIDAMTTPEDQNGNRACSCFDDIENNWTTLPTY